MGTNSSPLIDDHVSIEQCKKAVSALLKHVRDKQEKVDETELLPDKEQHVWLIITVKLMQPMKNLKPQKILIEHPLVDPRTTPVCLITKDPQREYKDLLESNNIKFISRVVGIEKLKGKFKGFDARRLLLRENGLFLADKRVVPLLPSLLGKQWFKAKKQPIPVTLTKKDLKSELENAISSTYMHQNKGTCTSIKIATISHTDNQVLSNLKTAIPAAVARIHGGWDNVQSFNIKTSNSVSLPIWTCPLGSNKPGSRWAGMTVDEAEWGGIGGEETDDDGQTVEQADSLKTTDASPHRNRNKRAADTDADAEAGVMKKSKKTQTAEPSSKLGVNKKESQKPRKLPNAAETTSSVSLQDGTIAKNTPSSVTTPADQPISKKGKKRRSSPEDLSSALAPSSTKPTPLTSVSDRAGLEKTSEETITREEMKQKRLVLGDTKIERKKVKVRKPEKSMRKGVKAQLVGKIMS